MTVRSKMNALHSTKLTASVACLFLSTRFLFADGPVGPTLQKCMIWSPSAPAGQQAYVAFRKSFTLQSEPILASLNIFADSRYILWVNGRYVLRGPCRFHPKRPEYDTLNFAPYLRKGPNTLTVLAHNYFGVVNGRIMSHAPGLTALLDVGGHNPIVTDASWRCSANTRYRPSPPAWSSIPDVIDAQVNDGEWMTPEFDDSTWEHAVAVDGKTWGDLQPRSIPFPKETPLDGLRLLPSREELLSVLPLELNSGEELLLDLGRMVMAYAEVDLEAAAGSVLQIRYALRYVDGRPAEEYGNGTTYTARGGRQSFVAGDMWGAHYLSVRCGSGKVKLHGFKVIDRRYPFTRVGAFKCSDPILTRLWENSVYTIETVTDDAYGSDARERDEWLQDPAEPNFITTRVALAGPADRGKLLYSDPRLLKNLLRHAALTQRLDGQIEATFPTDRHGDCHDIIEDYSCQWVEALRIYWEATQDREFLREMWPTLTRLMKWFWEHRTINGLVLAREYTSFDNPLAYITCEGATLNAFFYKALNDSAALATALRERQQANAYTMQARELAKAFNDHFWNSSESAYNSAIHHGRILGPTAHAQLIALDRGIVPDDRVAGTRKWFLANYKNPGGCHCCSNPDFESMVTNRAGINMPVTYYWVFQELYRRNTADSDLEALSEMRRRWTSMVTQREDTGTITECFIEGQGGSESCHNYGAVPAYFLSSYILGVRLEGPIWHKRLLLEPRLGDLESAEGVVCTEFGPVEVSWKQTGGALGFRFTVPRGVKAVVRLPRPSGESNLILNGRPRPGATIAGRFLALNLNAGQYTGQLTPNCAPVVAGHHNREVKGFPKTLGEYSCRHSGGSFKCARSRPLARFHLAWPPNGAYHSALCKVPG